MACKRSIRWASIAQLRAIAVKVVLAPMLSVTSASALQTAACRLHSCALSITPPTTND
jgi:hypothetical protein